MRKFKLNHCLFILATFAMVLSGCDGKEGPQGAEGPQGPQGVEGPAGNANVKMYKFGQMTFTNEKTLLLPNVTKAEMDNSILLAYYNPSNEVESAWYQMPGMGAQGLYSIRTLWFQIANGYNFSMRVNSPSGGTHSNSVSFRAVRIFIIPASQVINASAKTDQLPFDTANYQEVADWLNFK